MVLADSKYKPGAPPLNLFRGMPGPAPPVDKFADPVDGIPPWQSHCAWYGFSTIAIPVAHPGLNGFNGAICGWIDKKIQSKSGMAALAEHGIDMDHPCVRVFTKEEVDANRKFLAMSAKTIRVLGYHMVCVFTPRLHCTTT